MSMGLSRTFLARRGPLDAKNQAIVTVSVELIDGALTILSANHVNKRKAAALPSLAVDKSG